MGMAAMMLAGRDTTNWNWTGVHGNCVVGRAACQVMQAQRWRVVGSAGANEASVAARGRMSVHAELYLAQHMLTDLVAVPVMPVHKGR